MAEKKKEKTEHEKQIEALQEQVRKAESKGQLNTAHHQVLEQLLKPEQKNEIKGVIENG